MSLKATTFTYTNPAPKTLDKFCVVIPGIIDSPVRVSAAGLPVEGKQSTEIKIAGQSLKVPTTPYYPGTWTCTIDESLITDVLVQLRMLQTVQSIPSANESYLKTNYIRVLIFVTDQSTGLVPQYWASLKNCYLEKIEEPQLDWSKPGEPLRWRLTFRYTRISKFPLV